MLSCISERTDEMIVVDVIIRNQVVDSPEIGQESSFAVGFLLTNDRAGMFGQ